MSVSFCTYLDLRDEVLDAAEGDLVLVEVDAPPHRVDDGLGLLEDLLLHEVLVVALHDLLQLHLQSGHLSGTKKLFYINIFAEINHKPISCTVTYKTLGK